MPDPPRQQAPKAPMPDPPRQQAPKAPMPDPARGVFETLLVRDGDVQALGAHIARLAQSVSDLYGATLPRQLGDRVRSAARGRPGAYRVRVDAQPRDPGLELALAVTPVGDEARSVVRCRPVRVAGGIGQHKWADRRLLESLSEAGAVALIIDRDDQVLEAAWANFWLIEGTALITPPADGRLLPGVTRALLLELAPSLGLQTRTEPISLARASAADAIFLTSSLRHALAAELGSGSSRSADGSLVASIRGALANTDWE
jgi:para-aminobenzoate synthetase/4-amino-4-deoxychorismate lyase